MPTYEYACKDCGQHRDVVQSFHDDPLTECPSCGGNLRKVFSAAGIIFKGSGWHIKDYATSGAKAGEGNGSSGDGSSSNGDGGDKAGSSSGDGAGSGSSESSSATSTSSSGGDGASSTKATSA